MAHMKVILLMAIAVVVVAALTAVVLASRNNDPYSGTWMIENAPSDVAVIERGVGDSFVIHFTSVGNTLTFVKDGDRLSTGDAEQHIQAVGGKLRYWVNGTGDVWMVRKQ